jgi:hypothetical protein
VCFDENVVFKDSAFVKLAHLPILDIAPEWEQKVTPHVVALEKQELEYLRGREICTPSPETSQICIDDVGSKFFTPFCDFKFT